MDAMSTAPEPQQPAPMQDTAGPDRTLVAGPAAAQKMLPRPRSRAIDCGDETELPRSQPNGNYTNGDHRHQ